MESIGKSGRKLDDGFTLLELMVIVTIIGILLAIGIPSLLGARDRASDKAAMAKATQALKAQKIAASDAPQQFKPAADLELEDPNLNALPLADGVEPSVLGAVYVKDPTGDVVTLVARSATGTCFWTRAAKDGTTLYATNDCDPNVPAAAWGPEW